MVALASEDASFGAACQTAQDLVNGMSTVPRDYLRAFGTPLVVLCSDRVADHILTLLYRSKSYSALATCWPA